MVTPLRPNPKSAPVREGVKLDLIHRSRRNRKAEWTRKLVRENVLTTGDLIWPIFLVEGEKRREPVPSMPLVERLSVDEAVRAAEEAANLGIPAIALFPYTDPALRDPLGSEALNPQNLVCRACTAIKREVPQIGLVTDVALDPYTSHGCGARRAIYQPGARRGRYYRPFRHDGWPRWGNSRWARCARVRIGADHVLCSEICFGLLWPLP